MCCEKKNLNMWNTKGQSERGCVCARAHAHTQKSIHVQFQIGCHETLLKNI